MSRVSLALLVSILAGCGFQYNTVTPSGEQEAMLLSETDRFAKLMGVKVRGEITDTLAANHIPPVGQVAPTAFGTWEAWLTTIGR